MKLLPGYEDGTFGGKRPVTRYEVAYCFDLFVKTYGNSGGGSDNVKPYPDVDEKNWACEALLELKADELSFSYPDGTFGGNRPATRYELCAMFNKLWNTKFGFDVTPLKGGSTLPFVDVPTDITFYPAVERMRKYGILRSYPDGTFGGKRPASRYEFAAILDNFRRMIESWEAKDYGLAPSN